MNKSLAAKLGLEHMVGAPIATITENGVKITVYGTVHPDPNREPRFAPIGSDSRRHRSRQWARGTRTPRAW